MVNKYIAKFTGNDADRNKIYEQMKDYYTHYMSEVQGKPYGMYDKSTSLKEKDAKMHKALLSEIKTVSGQNFEGNTGVALTAWASNPSVMWATRVVMSMMIDAVLPDTVVKSAGVFSDITMVGYGETKQFDIEPNSLFTVSRGANAQRTAFRQRHHKTSVTIAPINHDITVYVPMYSVLAGDVSLAEFVRKAIISLDTAMTRDAYDAVETLIQNNGVPSALMATGYTANTLLNICQKVSAYNHGAKATVIGTPLALSHVLPDSTLGFRVTTPSDNMSINLIKDFYSYDVMALPQVAKEDGQYGVALNDNRIYVVSAGTQKIVQGVIEGDTLSYANDFVENADLTQNATFSKRWDFECCTNAVMGCVTLA